MPQRPVINPPPVSEMFFGPDGTEKSVFDSFPKRIAKSVTELLGLDAPPDPSDFANPLGAVIGKPAQKLSQQVIKTLSGETVPRGMRAYHGSPHQPFNRFDMNKIGTGEGAQAKGYGLYMAEDPNLGRRYQQGLSSRKLQDKIYDIESEYDNLDLIDLENMWDEIYQTVSPQEREFLQALRQDDLLGFDTVEEAIGESLRPGGASRYDLSPETLRARQNLGSLAEVNLNVRPEELLDLDRQMGQQTQGVQDAVNRALSSVEARRASYAKAAGSTHVPMRTIPDTTRAIDLTSPGYSTSPLGNEPRDVSRRLREAGIPGSTYLDQKSRAGFGGEIVDVSQVDGKWISTVRKKHPGTGFGSQSDELTYAKSRPSNTRDEAVKWAEETIAGGTRNIVMFDDDKIDIVKQLMLLLGLGAPAASAAQGLAEPQRPVLEPSI